eukprot:4918555-Lingulodinium_polyedra.AAC.1
MSVYGAGLEVRELSHFREPDAETDCVRAIRMGYLAVLGSYRVNGVAALHAEIVKKATFAIFY